MLREIRVFQFYNCILSNSYSRIKKEEDHMFAFNKIWRDVIKNSEGEVSGSLTGFRYQYYYSYVHEFHLTCFFITDLTDDASLVSKYLKKFVENFIKQFSNQLKEPLDAEAVRESKLFSTFEEVIDKIYEKLRPKVSIVGFSGVGKTTILNLIRDVEIPTEHVPTITGDRGRVKIGKLNFDFWDFAGQEEFRFVWPKFIIGSDAVLIVTDSTRENCEKSKEFIELIKEHEPNARYCVIGNKQDLQDSIPINLIEEIMGTKAYAMVANNPENRTRMLNIIGELLDIDIEGLDVLKILKMKDQYFSNALAAIKTGDLETAVLFLEKLVPVLNDMGDLSLANEINLTLRQLLDSKENNDQNNPLDLSFLSSDALREVNEDINESKKKLIMAEERLSILEFNVSLGKNISVGISEKIKNIREYADKLMELLSDVH